MDKFVYIDATERGWQADLEPHLGTIYHYYQLVTRLMGLEEDVASEAVLRACRCVHANMSWVTGW